MNKKIFTLLAASFMLLVTVFAANASDGVGPVVQSLPDGVGKGAYHLKVTHIGNREVNLNSAGVDTVLALHGDGYVYLVDSSYLFSYSNEDSTYLKLREALWCINVKPEVQGKRPTFTFTNKEYGLDLSFSTNSTYVVGREMPNGTHADLATSIPAAGGAPTNGTATSMYYYGYSAYQPSSGSMDNSSRYIKYVVTPHHDSAFVVGGDQSDWYFSDYYHTALKGMTYLAIADPKAPDFFYTLALDTTRTTLTNSAGVVQLVRVHKNDLETTAYFYRTFLIRFSIVEAAPRVLSVTDFNTQLGEKGSTGNIQLKFDPDSKNTELVNPFTAYTLTAEKGRGYDAIINGGDRRSLYLKLRVTNGDAAGQYVSVIDPGDNGNNYVNSNGKKYLKLGTVVKDKWYDEKNAEFRFVYYPSDESVIINARAVRHRSNPAHPNNGYEDLYSYPFNEKGVVTGDSLYNVNILDGLIVRAQTLDNVENKVLITVDSRPANVSISLGTGDCQIADDNRATIDTDLYLIRDSRNRYLTVPLYAGDFTPQWVLLRENEDPLKTPAFQWLVVRINEGAGSKVHIINREFDDIQFNYTQVYKTYEHFNGYHSYYGQGHQDYAAEVQKALIDKNSFIRVDDDPDAKAIYDAAIKNGTDVPGNVWEKLYRTSPYLGYKYIANDTLNYYSYSFNYLNGLSKSDYYLGFRPEDKISDTTMYAVKGSQFFDLVLPDSLRVGEFEEYGIGYLTNTVINTNAVLKALADDKHPVAQLVRRYYELRVNDVDIWNYTRSDNYICLDENKRYSYTNETEARGRQLGMSKFYLRFTYQPPGQPEYYTLLDRIDKSNFDYLSGEFGLSLTDTLKRFDASHGSYSQYGFGVMQAAVDPNNLFVKAQPKTIGAQTVSTFAVSRINEPLYRRFNTTDEDGEEGDDSPRYLKFFEHRNHAEYLFEDRMGPKSYIPGYAEKISYLGTENKATRDRMLADDPIVNAVLKTHNYAMYVDTAYVNRGTGWIKPQYLLVMDPEFIEAVTGCNVCNDPVVPRGMATYGRYLINATDSGRTSGSYVGQNKPVKDPNYVFGNWERLAFVPAIHINDTLFILRGFKSDKGNPPISMYIKEGQLDLDQLNRDASAGKIDKHTDLGDNFHKDYVFQFRFVERQYDEFGGKSNLGKHFLIESETTNRSITQGRMIAPSEGGWVKIDNEVVVISRGAYDDAILEAEWFDVEPAGDDKPLATEGVNASTVTVLSGTGNINILNASGKSVVISNVLGQIVTKTVLTSDNATIAAPRGVVVVAVDGENAVKAIVK